MKVELVKRGDVFEIHHEGFVQSTIARKSRELDKTYKARAEREFDAHVKAMRDFKKMLVPQVIRIQHI